jgi:predicted metal-dependent HD superfamily phosphohydrolase
MRLNVNKDNLIELSDFTAPIIFRNAKGDKFLVRLTNDEFEYWSKGKWHSTAELPESTVEPNKPLGYLERPTRDEAESALENIHNVFYNHHCIGSDSEERKLLANKIIGYYEKQEGSVYNEHYLGRCLTLLDRYAHQLGDDYTRAYIVILCHRAHVELSGQLVILQEILRTLKLDTVDDFLGDCQNMLRVLEQPTWVEAPPKRRLIKCIRHLKDIVNHDFALGAEEFKTWFEQEYYDAELNHNLRRLELLYKWFVHINSFSSVFKTMYFKPFESAARENLSFAIKSISTRINKIHAIEKSKFDYLKGLFIKSTKKSVSDAEEEWYEIYSHYSRQNRPYHNIDHIYDICKTIQGDSATDEMFLAAIYHDYHNVGNADYSAEELSTFACSRSLKKLGVPLEKINVVNKIILATENLEIDPDASMEIRLFVEADRAILGSPAHHYNVYARNIEAEVKESLEINDESYIKGRINFLSRVLKNEPIFHNLTHLNSQAHDNISRELEYLKSR